MPSNIELKVKIPSFRKYEKVLKTLELKPKELLNQKDVYYEIKKGLLKLRIENGKNSIIEYSRNETSKNRVSNYNVLSLNDDTAEKFLGRVFNIKAVVEKKRILYLYKNTRIHLDKVKKLGNFIELESVVVRDNKSAVKEFNEVIDLLNLDTEKQIRKSYKDLIIKK